MRRKRSCAYDQGQQNKIINVRAVITGLDGVGKSALTVRFLTRRFIGEYDENLEMTYRHHMTLEGKYVTLDIMDTAGKNTEKKLETLTSFGDLFFILYSITDRFSFMEAKRLGRHIKNARNNQCTLILVGTKTDLGHHRKITDNEGVQLAKELGSEFCQISIAEGYVETNSLLYDSLRLHLNNKNIERSETKTPEHENSDKDKSGPLSWMKEGFKGIYTRRKSIA
ncbi:ras-related and estrogen-regulated growth inhibitor-like [Montipora capricornis]|uniref:ras-related and estrogen-regulated growth inhibitor-like n=1 Tax=Montipora capricornis TaxID=246305 RepID=UPI0035F205E9